MIIYHNGVELKLSISTNNINIKNSYKIRCRKNILSVIKQMKEKIPNHLVSSISNFSLVNEWACHNICYRLGIYKERTRDVDLDYGKPWYINILYNIIGMFYL